MPDIVYGYEDVPTIKRFSTDNTRQRMLIGPFGSGKSSGCVIQLVERAMAQAPMNSDGVRRSRWAVVRNSYPQLRDTTIKTFLYWLGNFGDYRVTDHDFILNKLSAPDGSKIEAEVHFRALDQPKHVANLLSLELTGAWFNEAREIPRIIWDTMDGRVDRYPPMQEGGPTWAGIWADTNPPDTDHWIYKLFEENKPLTCPKCQGLEFVDHKCPRCGETVGIPKTSIYHQPSGLSPEAENLRNLRPGYYEQLAAGKDANFVKVYVHGQYGYVMDGRPIYSNWNRSIHVANEILKPVPGLPLVLGWDFGSQAAACIVCQYTEWGFFYVVEEFIVEDMGARRFANQIVKPFMMAHYPGFELLGVGDLWGGSRAASDESTCFQELIAARLPAKPCRTNAWQPRFNAVDSLLTKMVRGKPALQVSPNCKGVIKGFDGEYRMRRLQIVGKEIYADRPEKNMASHVHDALQYAAMYVEDGFKNAQRSAGIQGPRKAPPTGAWT